LLAASTKNAPLHLKNIFLHHLIRLLQRKRKIQFEVLKMMEEQNVVTFVMTPLSQTRNAAIFMKCVMTPL